MSTTIDLRARLDDIIRTEPVALFMKGTPQFVMCGNSARANRSGGSRLTPAAAAANLYQTCRQTRKIRSMNEGY